MIFLWVTYTYKILKTLQVVLKTLQHVFIKIYIQTGLGAEISLTNINFSVFISRLKLTILFES